MKPMLAATCDDMSLLRYPLLATPKIDGIRCLMIDGVATSRSLKPIPNRYIQEKLGDKFAFNDFDGELFLKPVGDLLSKREPTFQEVSSAVMREDGTPDFVYRVFDAMIPNGYTYRMGHLRAFNEYMIKASISLSYIEFLFPELIETREALDEYLLKCLAEGHEGVMVRHPDGLYKHGRSTFKEHGLIKIKPFEDAEAEIIGFEEQMHNSNEATVNALGRTERSHHQSGMVGKNTLGALVCKCNANLWKFTFNVGTGFDDAIRYEIWHNQAKYLGQSIKYKYQKIGSLDRPRIPVFLGFRSKLDKS